jgi:hypothetical protein
MVDPSSDVVSDETINARLPRKCQMLPSLLR